jgi:Fe2+ transport system protein B
MEIANPELLYERIMDEEDLAIMKEKQELEDVKYKYMPEELKAKIKKMEKDEKARKEKKIQSLINQNKIAKGEKIAENEVEAKLAEESISNLDDEAIQKLKLIEKMNGNLSEDSKDFEKKKLNKQKLESSDSIDWVKLSLFVGSILVFIILVLFLLRVLGIFDILGIF